MNILFLTNHLNIGGISSYVLTLAKGLKDRGHNVYVASSGGELISQFHKQGIIYIPIPIKTKAELSPKIFFSLLKLLKVIREKNIDIIHANTRVTQVLGCLIQGCAHKPLISTCHGFFKKRLLRRIFPCWGKRVIAISEEVKRHLEDTFEVKSENIRLIHNGIDIDKFTACSLQLRAELKQKIGLTEGPVIGIVARLSDVKGHIHLIEAMKTVLENIPQAQLLIVGEGRMQKELINLTRQLRIQKNILFIPSVLDTRETLSMMDIFLMPSLKEGLGLALMEAMAQGLAVIGSRVGGIKTLIQDGKNGLLVEPADVEGLSRAILALLEDDKKRESLGSAARNFIEQNFSQERMVSETQELYLECLNPTLSYAIGLRRTL